MKLYFISLYISVYKLTQKKKKKQLYLILPCSNSFQKIRDRHIIMCQLRARRVLSTFKDVPLRTRRALPLCNVYGDSALLVLNGISLNSDCALLALNWQYDIQACQLFHTSLAIFNSIKIFRLSCSISMLLVIWKENVINPTVGVKEMVVFNNWCGNDLEIHWGDAALSRRSHP